jgi:hypothetical protein
MTRQYDNTSFNGCAFIKELPPVYSRAGNKRRIAEWKCSCGKSFEASVGNITSGNIKSCGCKKREAILKRCSRHGHSPNSGGTRIYRFWQSMKERCLNGNSWSFHHYGARGIKIYPAWTSSFETFFNYFQNKFKMVEIPYGLSMDRINNNGDYEPDNLRLATSRIQNNNKRNNRVIIYNGEKMTITQLAKKVGINRTTIAARINKQNKTVKQAIL